MLVRAPAWEEKGGKVAFTLYENLQRDVPAKEDLLAFEHNANGDPEDNPFRPLNDRTQIINSNFRDPGNLPYVVILDREMVIRLRGANPGMDNVYREFERLLNEPDDAAPADGGEEPVE